MNINNTFEYASWANSIQPSIMQKMLERSSSPDMISFALGLPDPDLFPIAEYKESLNNVANSAPRVFQYSPPIQSLKKHIVKLMASRNVRCKESQIFITAGAQQALSLLSRLMLEQGGTLATGSITYPGFLQVVTPLSPQIIGVPIAPHSGLCLDTLKKAFTDQKRKPAFFYIVSDGHNPLGLSLSNMQKRSIAELSREHKIPIIEDDCYGFLNYDTPTRPIKSYEDEWVFYVGSFSKILSPSFRTGWIIAPEEIVAKLAFSKEAMDINTSSFGNRIVDDLLNRDILLPHLQTLKNHYKERRDVMIKSIKEHFPVNIKMSEPENGFFVWVELPNNINTTTLLDVALDNNIAFVPSEEFACNNKEKKFNGMRLNFSHCKPTQIKQGIEKLGYLISGMSINVKEKNANAYIKMLQNSFNTNVLPYMAKDDKYTKRQIATIKLINAAFVDTFAYMRGIANQPIVMSDTLVWSAISGATSVLVGLTNTLVSTIRPELAIAKCGTFLCNLGNFICTQSIQLLQEDLLYNNELRVEKDLHALKKLRLS